MNMMQTTGRTAGRFLRTLAVSEGLVDSASAFLAGQRWVDKTEVEIAVKTAVSGLGFDDIASQPAGTDFLATLRPRSILGRLTAARHVPFRQRVIVFGTGTRASVVASGAPIPLSKASITGDIIEPVKVGGLSVLTGETLAMSGGVAADQAIADDLAMAVASAEDVLFIDPAQPGSALAGATPIPSSGSTLAQIDADLAAAVDALIAGGSTLLSAAWVMSSHTATKLGLLRGSGGAPAYPDIGGTGGTLLKMPVIVSDTAANVIVLIDQSGIVIGDGGAVRVALAESASVQMLDNPSNNALTPTPTTAISMFQTNSIAIRAIVESGWLVRPGAAQYISGIAL